MSTSTDGGGGSDGETRKERIDRELIELLNELRVALPGVQFLFAFLLIVPFQQKADQVSAPCHHAIASDPSTPQAAHSVAVAQPISNDRNTKAISNRQGIRLSDSAIFLRRLMGGSAGGVRVGLASDQAAM